MLRADRSFARDHILDILRTATVFDDIVNDFTDMHVFDYIVNCHSYCTCYSAHDQQFVRVLYHHVGQRH